MKYWDKNWHGIHSLEHVPLYDINEVEILERFGNKRMTTEQCALPELSIEIRVGVRIGDRGQPDTLVLLAVV